MNFWRLILFSVFLPFFAQAQKTYVYGTVKNVKGLPIESANISVSPFSQLTTTDRTGSFKISIPKMTNLYEI